MLTAILRWILPEVDPGGGRRSDEGAARRERELHELKDKLSRTILSTLMVGGADTYEVAKRAVDLTTSLAVNEVQVEVSSYPAMFPRLAHENDAMIVLCNHASDLDQYVLNFCLGRAWERHEREAARLDDDEAGGTTRQRHSVRAGPPKMRGVAFTHSHFADVPVVGGYVRRFLVGLSKGDDEASVAAKIRDKVRLFNPNVWLLFPEGRILDRESLATSREYVRSLGTRAAAARDGRDWTLVLYPRFKAYRALVRELGERLKFVVDCTIAYPETASAPLAGRSFSYLDYPSMLTYMLGSPNCPVPRVHFGLYTVQDGADLLAVGTRDWLLHVWRKKQQRLQTMRASMAGDPAVQSTPA